MQDGLRNREYPGSSLSRYTTLKVIGTVDKYEDWRLPSEDRAKDLLAKMSMEEKVGFMLISTTR